MTEDEEAMVYFVAYLVQQEQYSIADSIITKQLQPLNASKIFHANIKRFQAISWFQLLKVRCDESNMPNDS